MTPEARRTLRRAVERELDTPGGAAAFREELARDFPELEPVLRLVTLQDEEHRASFYVRSESVWYRRFGFKLMRPLFLVGVVAAVLFSLQSVVDPALALGCFLAGAFALYVVFQIFAHRWSRQDQQKLVELRERYRQRLQRLRDELDEDGQR